VGSHVAEELLLRRLPRAPRRPLRELPRLRHVEGAAHRAPEGCRRLARRGAARAARAATSPRSSFYVVFHAHLDDLCPNSRGYGTSKAPHIARPRDAGGSRGAARAALRSAECPAGSRRCNDEGGARGRSFSATLSDAGGGASMVAHRLLRSPVACLARPLLDSSHSPSVHVAGRSALSLYGRGGTARRARAPSVAGGSAALASGRGSG